MSSGHHVCLGTDDVVLEKPDAWWGVPEVVAVIFATSLFDDDELDAEAVTTAALAAAFF